MFVGVIVLVGVFVGVGVGQIPKSLIIREFTPPVLTTLFFLAHKKMSGLGVNTLPVIKSPSQLMYEYITFPPVESFANR